ncbi:MAG: hypothetical protein V4662_02170 [Verrucomicrobiota bacterium]
MKLLRSICRIALLAFMIASGPLPAVDAPQENGVELARLRFQRSMIEASLAPLKKHLLDLSELEKKRAETRDYAGAIAVRNERRQVEDELERLDKELLLLQTREQSLKASALPDRISLSLEQAQLADVRREGGELTGWSRPGSSASWKLPALPPGGYEIYIKHRCGALDGGLLEVKETKFHLTSQIDTTSKGPQEKNLGTLKITDGTGTLTLTATTLVKDNLMHLLGLWLVPASK